MLHLAVRYFLCAGSRLRITAFAAKIHDMLKIKYCELNQTTYVQYVKFDKNLESSIDFLSVEL